MVVVVLFNGDDDILVIVIVTKWAMFFVLSCLVFETINWSTRT